MASGSLVDGCGTATFLHKSNKELSLRDVILMACWCKTTKREKWFVPNKGHYDVRHVLTSLQQRKRAPSLFASQGGNDVLSRSFESLQPKLHGSAGARRRTTSTQCFEDRIGRLFKQSDHPGHSCSPQHDSSPINSGVEVSSAKEGIFSPVHVATIVCIQFEVQSTCVCSYRP